MQNIKSFDISVEEFDAINEEHVFSDRYNKRKAAVLKSYKDRKLNKHNAGALKAAAAVLIGCSSSPRGDTNTARRKKPFPYLSARR